MYVNVHDTHPSLQQSIQSSEELAHLKGYIGTIENRVASFIWYVYIYCITR